HRGVSAIWVLRERARQTGATDVAMPVVFTSALGLADDLVGLDLPFGDQVGGLSQPPQVWLDCQVTERGGGLFVNWDAVEGLFPAGVLDGVFEVFVGLLGRLGGGGWWGGGGVAGAGGGAVAGGGVAAAGGARRVGVVQDGFFGWAERDPGRPALLWG